MPDVQLNLVLCYFFFLSSHFLVILFAAVSCTHNLCASLLYILSMLGRFNAVFFHSQQLRSFKLESRAMRIAHSLQVSQPKMAAKELSLIIILLIIIFYYLCSNVLLKFICWNCTNIP